MEDKKRHSPSRGQTFLGKAVSLEGVDTLGRKAERPAGLWGGGDGKPFGGWGARDKKAEHEGPKDAGEAEGWRGGTMKRADTEG